MSLGETIRIFRIANDYTISKLSNLTGLSKSYLSELENESKGKKPSQTTLESLEKALNCPKGSILKYHSFSEEKNLDFKQTLLNVVFLLIMEN